MQHSISQSTSRPLAETQSSRLSTTAKAGIGMGGFLGIAIIFLIGFCWGKKRRRTPDHVHLSRSRAPPVVELSPNSASATKFNKRPRTRLPYLEPPSEVSNAGEIHELPGHGQVHSRN